MFDRLIWISRPEYNILHIALAVSIALFVLMVCLLVRCIRQAQAEAFCERHGTTSAYSVKVPWWSAILAVVLFCGTLTVWPLYAWMDRSEAERIAAEIVDIVGGQMDARGHGHDAGGYELNCNFGSFESYPWRSNTESVICFYVDQETIDGWKISIVSTGKISSVNLKTRTFEIW